MKVRQSMDDSRDGSCDELIRTAKGRVFDANGCWKSPSIYVLIPVLCLAVLVYNCEIREFCSVIFCKLHALNISSTLHIFIAGNYSLNHPRPAHVWTCSSVGWNSAEVKYFYSILCGFHSLAIRCQIPKQ